MTDDPPEDLADQETIYEDPGREASEESQGDETLDEDLSPSLVDSEPSDLDELSALLESTAGERLHRVARLARGGMGTIDLVRDLALKRRLAKKQVAGGLRENVEILRSFVREAQITGQLDHPSIVPVHELGIDPRGGFYFTMKVVEGVTLHEYRRRVVDAREHDWLFELLEVILKICDALAFAHNRNIVHLDVKPSNVMVGEFGQVYLMDWGLARPPAAAASQDLAGEVAKAGGKGAIVGTPAFMAPEQAGGGPLDRRTDVFGVGSLLYFGISGRAPYRGDTARQSLELARGHRLEPLAEVAATPPPSALLRIVTKAMAAAPADRHQTVGELRDELTRILRGGVASPPRRVAAGEHILREGQAGEEVYVLMSGRAEAYRIAEGQRKSLGIMEAGDVIGELAFLTGSRRTASVVALVDCTLLEITRETLERELSGMQPWMAALTRSLAKRFREREMAAPSAADSQRSSD